MKTPKSKPSLLQTKSESAQKRRKAPKTGKRWERPSRLQPLAKAQIISAAIKGRSVAEIREKLGFDKDTIKAVIFNSEEVRQINEKITSLVRQHLEEAAKTVVAALFVDYKFALEMLDRFNSLPSAPARTATETVAQTAPGVPTGLSAALSPDAKVREVPGDTVEFYGSKISKTYLPFFARFFEVLEIGDKENGLEPPVPLPGKEMPEVIVENGKIVDIRPPKITPVPEDGEQTS